MMRYKSLSLVTREQIWANFLKKIVTVNEATKYNFEDLDELTRKNLNDRQVRASEFSRISSNLLILIESFIVDQKHDRRDSCIDRVSQHQDVYVSFRIDHQFEREIWIWFRWCWSSFQQALLSLALTVTNTFINCFERVSIECRYSSLSVNEMSRMQVHDWTTSWYDTTRLVRVNRLIYISRNRWQDAHMNEE